APAEPATAEAAAEAEAASPAETPAPTAPEPSAAPPAAAQQPSGNGKAFVSPVVARIASEHGVDPSQVPGTGSGGRVTKKDILAFLEADASRTASGAPPAAAPPASTPPAATAPPPTSQEAQPPGIGESVEPMSAMRR